jgi:hypothetical protein
VRIACLSDAVRIGVGAFAGAGLLLTASGCLATRPWVEGVEPSRFEPEVPIHFRLEMAY